MRRMAGYLRKIFLASTRPFVIFGFPLCCLRYCIFRVRIVTELAGKT